MEIAAAVIGVADVAVRTSSKLWALSAAWRDAPLDLHSLRDDLTRTERFFGEIRQSLDRISLTQPGSMCDIFMLGSDLHELIDEGSLALRRVEAIVDGFSAIKYADTKAHSDKIREMGSRRKLLWLRQSRKVARLRQELAHIKSSICRILIVQNVSISTDIHAFLESSRNEARLQIDAFSQELEESQDNMLARLDDRLLSMEHRILSVVDRKPDLNQELQSQGKTTPVANTWKTDKALDTVSPRRASSCDLSCDCSCHHPATFSWALKVLPWQPTLGAIAIEYSSRGSQACTNMACRDFQAGRLIRQIRIAYHVPDWLARISIDSFFSTNAGGSPQLNIRVYNRRPAKELIEIGGPAWLIERGDIEGIKRALQDGRLSIYDKFGMNLATPLRIALGNRQIDAIKLFLDAGSDPFHKIGPNHGRSVVAIAFQESIAGDALDREIANLFPIADYVDEANFSPLHLAIIGIMHFSLSEALQDPKFEPFVNQASEDGFTPLHIAALRGDLAATKALVRMGADVSAQTIYKTEPLYFACAHGYYEVAEVLLAAGANADNQDDLGRAAVHGAAQSASKDARTTLALLVRYGVNLAILDFSGSSALHYASTYGGTGAAVQFLLEVGLDVNCRDSDGGSPIVESILYHRYDAAEILLGFGCDVSVVDNGGKGVLHHLASNGDRQMMDIFARRRIKSLSSSAKDDEGNTPLVLFNRRHANNPEGELRKAFENLLESVEHYSWINDRRDDNTGDAGDSSDDEFFDAHDMNDAEMRKEKLH